MIPVQQGYEVQRRAMRIPEAPAEVVRVCREVLKLPTVRDRELVELRENFEGDHETMVSRYFVKPPSWDDATWAYLRKDLMHVNSTRTSLRTLAAGVYGGIQVRKLEGPGAFVAQLNDWLASPEYGKSVTRLLREMVLYGTAYAVPAYDKAQRQFRVEHLNPVTTHVLVDALAPEVPVAVAEFDARRNWVRIWTAGWYARCAREMNHVELHYWVRDVGEDLNETEYVERPYLPVLVARAEDLPGTPYGISLLRDTPRFNRSLAKSYFNVAYTSTLKAQALLVLTSGEANAEMHADLQQLGSHAALVMDKDSAAQFISSPADVRSLLEVVEQLQDLESYVLGIPAVRSHKNLSAEGARLAAAPLTSQVSMVAKTMAGVETALVSLTAREAHWSVQAPLDDYQARQQYVPTVRLDPVINLEGLAERTSSYTTLAAAGVKSEEDVVATFNPHLTYPEIQAQAAVMRERQGAKAAPPTGDGGSRGEDPEDESAGDESAG